MNKAVIHALHRHQHDANFKVSCMFPGCLYTSQSWPAFKKHVRRTHVGADVGSVVNLESSYAHSQEAEADPDLLDQIDLTNAPDPSAEQETQLTTAQTLLSKFVLSLETRHHMTRKGLGEITGTLEELADLLSLQIQGDVRAALEEDPNINVCDVIAASCKIDAGSLATDRSRHGVFQRHFHYIPPEPVSVRDKESDTDSDKTLGHFVSFEALLQLLCRQNQIWACIKKKAEKRPSCNDQVFRDFADGFVLRHHTLTEANFLQVALFYDDLELQNPLRSNKRHKMAMFYVTLLNIPPFYRSQLQNIFAVAIAPVENVKKEGFMIILQDFLQTMRKLKTTGLLVRQGELLFGDLVAVMCDTPAAAALGGFKESCAFADHFCRTCMASNETYMQHNLESDFQLRTLESYDEQCKVLEKFSLDKRRRQYWSKMYGVNSRSCLCAIPDFDVTESLLQDPMHVVLEGCLPFVLALFLNDVIYERKLFKLSELNAFLLKRPKSRQDRPLAIVPIDPKDLKKKHHVKQKASSMLTLAYILPFFLGRHVDETDEKYENLLTLIRITVICFKPIVDVTTSGVLAHEIADFLTTFSSLYTAQEGKPKMHFLVHLPTQMLKFGPLRHHSTMRSEAKHQFFKDHRWSNFNNLSFSLLKRHQLCLANVLSDSRGQLVSNFLQEATTYNTCHIVRETQVSDLEDSYWFTQQFHLQETDMVAEHRYLRWRGRDYDNTCCILISESESKGPCFLKIDKIYTDALHCYILGFQVKTHDFCVAFNAYRISVEETMHAINLSEVTTNWPLPMHEVDGQVFVVNRYGIST